MSQIQIRDQFGQPVPRINIRFADAGQPSEAAFYDVFSDLAGNTGWPVFGWPHKSYAMYVNHANVDPRYGRADVTTDSQDDIAITLPLVVNQRVQLGVDRQRFIFTEAGAPWLFKGLLLYNLLNNVRQGRDLAPLLREAAMLGANTVVAFGMMLDQWHRDHDMYVDPEDPAWPTWLETARAACEDIGLRFLPMVLYSTQDRSFPQQTRYCAVAAEVLRGHWNGLFSRGNEEQGYTAAAFGAPDLGDMPWANGSYGTGNAPQPPYLNDFQFAMWEGRREPYHKAMDDAGAGILEMHAGYRELAAVTRPIVVIEPPIFNETNPDRWGDYRWTSLEQAKQLGVNIGAASAGGSFGSSDSLEALPQSEAVKAMARGFYRGMDAAFQARFA